MLGVPCRFALDPVGPAAARPVGGPASGQRAVQRLVVHPGHHQHLTATPLLHHRTHQPVGVALELAGDLWVQAAHRTVTPAARRPSFTSLMRSCPKWNTLAASTASAPAA